LKKYLKKEEQLGVGGENLKKYAPKEASFGRSETEEKPILILWKFFASKCKSEKVKQREKV